MQNRIIWVDLIKTVAIISVLILHASSNVVNQFQVIPLDIWNIANIYDSMTRMSVPLFFMLSGALLLNHKDETLRDFFLKRFVKVVIPLIGFSIIYIMFVKYALHNNIDIVQHFFQILYKKQYYHLWFLYTLLGLYLFIPILKIFVKNSTRTMQLYFLFFWLIHVSILPLINTFTSLSVPIYMPMMSGYTGLLLLGFLLANFTVNKKVFFLALLMIVISTYITVYGTYILSTNVNKFQSYFYSNLSLNILIQSVSYFIVLKYIGEKLQDNQFIVRYFIIPISATSFGIYLIHPMFLWILHLKEVGIYALNGNNITIMIPIVALSTLTLSFIAVYLMKNITILKRFVP